jgi:energy-coupling factor transporter ATP-binding protein EcfA2
MANNKGFNNNVSDFYGSKWWKIDFHTHTPASNDYESKSTTPENWLKNAMDAGLNCVIVSDHNSGGWIGKLKSQNDALRNLPTKPQWYRELFIFPGIEITVADSASRIHLLAVFDTECDENKITAVLGACGITSGFGDETNTATNKGFLDVVKAIRDADGIAIPAHIDGKMGLLNGKTSLTPELHNSLESVFAGEFCDLNTLNEVKPDLKNAINRLAKVAGSDAHKPEDIGKHASWIKMSRPSIGGLRLALRDHDFCVKNQEEDPNNVPNLFLSKLTIYNLKVCGRIPEQPLVMPLHSHFNALIGGRGTGKSTMIEAIRLATRQNQTLKESSRTKKRVDDFISGVTCNDTEILLEIYRHGVAYRLRWRQDGTGSVLEEKHGDKWRATEAGNIIERFPVSIYSQKQIEELASNPRGLLEIIDRATDVNRIEWQTRWDDVQSQFLQLKERERELMRRLDNEPQIRVKLTDIEKDLNQYEEKGHGLILKNYQKQMRQKNALPLKKDFEAIEQQISAIVPSVALPDFPTHLFDADDPLSTEMQSIHKQTVQELQDVGRQLQTLAKKVIEIYTSWETAIQQSKFEAAWQQSRAAYENLMKEYAEKASSLNLATYGEWVNQRNQLQQQLRDLESSKKDLASVREQIKSLREQFLMLRSELLQKRKTFVQNVIGKNQYVRMEFIAFGDTTTAEDDYRKYLELGSAFSSSVYEPENQRSILFPFIHWEKPDDTNQNLLSIVESVKSRTMQIAKGECNGSDARFDSRLKQLLINKPQSFDHIETWFPEDLLQVKYSLSPSNSKFNDLERGSAGQKAAAILAFILSYGDEPLIIDQPEDDLDNALISDLIVKQIHENKNHRQLIVATHNPNIVVNGDAELVHVMKFSGGQIQIDTEGGLEEKPVRESICTIMEGGKDAFEKRYKRITLED